MTDPFGVDRLQLGDHACWAFDRDEERLDGTASVLVAGIRAGQKVLCRTETMTEAALLFGLAARGVAVGEALDRGQLRVQVSAEAYLRDGDFDPNVAIDELGHQLTLARDEGWAGLRVISDMAWALRLEPGSDRLNWFEAHLNRLFVDGLGLALCQYDRRLFAASELRRFVGAHTTSAVAEADGGWTAPLRVRRTGDRAGVELIGEADLSNREALAAILGLLVDEVREHDRPCVVDLTRLNFADTAAAGLLIRAGVAAPAGMRLVGCRPPIARLLAMLGADQVPGITVETPSQPHLNGAPA